jgi:hypothetical protein
LRCFFSASWTIAQSVFVSLWCSSLISNHAPCAATLIHLVIADWIPLKSRFSIGTLVDMFGMLMLTWTPYLCEIHSAHTHLPQ